MKAKRCKKQRKMKIKDWIKLGALIYGSLILMILHWIIVGY